MKRFLQTFLLTFLFAAPAFAHDPSLHKGPKVEGKVVSINGDRLEVGTMDGVVAVALSPETSFEGMGGEKATKSAVKAGQEVMISGRKLASGEFAATEVMIHGANDGDESKPHSHDSH